MCGGVNTESPRVGNTQSLKTQSQVYFYTFHNKSVNSVCLGMKNIKKKQAKIKRSQHRLQGGETQLALSVLPVV